MRRTRECVCVLCGHEGENRFNIPTKSRKIAAPVRRLDKFTDVYYTSKENWLKNNCKDILCSGAKWKNIFRIVIFSVEFCRSRARGNSIENIFSPRHTRDISELSLRCWFNIFFIAYTHRIFLTFYIFSTRLSENPVISRNVFFFLPVILDNPDRAINSAPMARETSHGMVHRSKYVAYVIHLHRIWQKYFRRLIFLSSFSHRNA